MDLISIVGARPQFVKLAMVCDALRKFGGDVRHRIVHTGQHYDAGMSDIFFSELHIPEPDFHLGVGSGSHGVQTGEMMKRLEPVLQEHPPSWALLYGDTNSTLAGAVVCAKLGIPSAHIEAGLRSFNRKMPEEINRVVADHLSEILFCPTSTAVQNLKREGLAAKAQLCGDVMYDAALYYRAQAEARGGPLAARWEPKTFALATVHRAENTDDPTRLRAILSALDQIAADVCPVLFPVHPRTKKVLAEAGIQIRKAELTEPLSYLDMLLLEGRARFILTDSGGVQKEAYFAQVPCITLRDETEWVETLENGCNILAGADAESIWKAAADSRSRGPWTNAYGEGQAGRIMVEALAGGAPEAARS